LSYVVPTSVGSSFKMEVDSSPTPLDVTTKIDGVALSTVNLKRNELLFEKLQWLDLKKSIILLSLPAASGKTSLYKLFQAANKTVEVVSIYCWVKEHHLRYCLKQES
jgi:hypothetical protein